MCCPRGNSVESEPFIKACGDAFKKCSTADCVRDDVGNAFDTNWPIGRYKFCPNQMTLMVTSKRENWAVSGFGVQYFSDNFFYCIAYCTP